MAKYDPNYKNEAQEEANRKISEIKAKTLASKKKKGKGKGKIKLEDLT